MIKVAVIGKDFAKIENIKKKLEGRGFEYVDDNPDVVVAYGGDGIFLISERIFPEIPKILIKDSDVGNMAHDLDICEVIDLYLEKKFKVQEIRKIKGIRRGRFEVRSLIGVNDIVIRNSLPTEAIRFRYRINDGSWSKIFIGDGLVITTPYGSSKGAYFYSVARESIEAGFGVAFNNTTEEIEPLILNVDDSFEIEIVRGQGVMVADNNRDLINLEVGDKIIIQEIDEVARRIVLKLNS